MAFSNKEIYKKPERPKTNLDECLLEFQQKVHQKKPTPIPPPPLPKDSVHNQPDLEYKILQEFQHIHRLIKENGRQGDFSMEITFGELIPIFGAAEVDRLAEILANARRNGYVNYKLNDFLQQDRDEDVIIKSIKTPF
ncbi:unnamed protein product [Rotaria sp. Silwood1]|nr:unnamed protein product [Rotaria sp. Silwood1]CAF1154219.1 unnamed protein product [Rotaria sp. Silwood1]CAF3463113.1 unnamed protein product [Rotaria sp. Silwood1]CAF3470149.1 unnamed protein product [Rotaria sp. Silwood1]CAF3472586.1 unnamed protein product [Rotaria sp. Silwood1]